MEGRVEESVRSSDRMVDVALDLFESRGMAGVSARVLANEADVPVSSIYYHFGNLEQLFHVALEQALNAARFWCAQRLAEIPPRLPGPDALAPFLAAVIESWCRDQRRLAFAWRECQLQAARNPAWRPMLARWDAMWRELWETLCARCDIPDWSEATGCFFDGESLLHLLFGVRPVDRACLVEMCAGWAAWARGVPAPEMPWRDHARAQAMATRPEPDSLNETPRRIAAAAAELLARAGAAGVTHRAVAAEAGVTLGVVSYHFRTSGDLLRGGFESIYAGAVHRYGAAEAEASRRNDLSTMREGWRYRASPEGGLAMLGMFEMMVFVARHPELFSFAAQLRYLRGRTGTRVAEDAFGRPVTALEGALYSGLTMGEERAAIAQDEPGRMALFERIRTQLTARLSAR